MGRAGPTQLTGPDSAQKGLGRSWPNKVFYFSSGPDLAQTSVILAHKHKAGPEPVWPREGKTYNAGPESAWPGNITSGGNYFPPPLLHAERCGKTTKVQTIRGEKSYLAWRRWCVAGLAASLAVLRWRPVAGLWLTGGGSKQ